MALNCLNYTPEVLEAVRAQLRTLYDETSNKLDKVLYHRLQEDDFELCRYIRRRQGRVQQSVDFLVSVLEWHKKNDIAELSVDSFPSEFLDYGGLYTLGHDVNGNVVLHIRVALFVKQPELTELFKKYIIFWMRKADQDAAKNGNGWILIFDCTNAGIANADIELPTFINSILRDYFPYGQQYILVVNLSWLLTAIKNVIYSFLPEIIRNRVKFCNTSNITEHISLDNLPKYLGGSAASDLYRLKQSKPCNLDAFVEQGILPLKPPELARLRKNFDKLRDAIQKEEMKETKTKT